MIEDIRLIRAFLAVARLSSFTRAAAELHVSQPTLTVRIRQLEEEAGVRLLDRDKRHVRLTQAGRGLLGPLKRVVADMEAVMCLSQDLADLRRGTVAVAALPSVAASLLPAALRRFSADYPGIVLHVADMVSEKVIEQVLAEEVDFGIGSCLRPEKAIEFLDLISDRMCAYIPEGHPLSGRKSLSLRDLAGHPLVLTNVDSSARALVERAMERQGLDLNLVCDANYMSTAVGMVRAGLGIGILPESAVDCSSCQGIAVAVVGTPGLVRKIGIITKARRSLSPAAERFAGVLRQVAGQPLSHFSGVRP